MSLNPRGNQYFKPSNKLDTSLYNEKLTLLNFKTLPQKRDNGAIISQASQDYDYNAPGMMTLANRVPDNLVGQDLRNATRIA